MGAAIAVATVMASFSKCNSCAGDKMVLLDVSVNGTETNCPRTATTACTGVVVADAGVVLLLLLYTRY